MKQRLSDTTYKRHGVKWPSQIPHIQSKMRRHICYDNCWFDSCVEVAFYIWLKDNCASFEVHPDCALKYVFNGVEHSYFPDFSICGTLYEVKGDHFFKEDGTMQNPYNHAEDSLYEAKRQCMLKNNVVVLRASECEAFVGYVASKHGPHFLKQLKRTSALQRGCGTA